MSEARYDAVADFYIGDGTDDYTDPPTAALLVAVGAVDGLDVLDVACGHGRLSRELARRGGRVVGMDLSGRMIAAAEEAEAAEPLGVRYVCADAADPGDWLATAGYDVATCSFGLSDIDDLDGVLGVVARALRPGGRFAFSILHPCFPGGGGGRWSASWPADGSYYDEGWWAASGELSLLRRRVGANHRMLSTYLNALHRHGLDPVEVTEPRPRWMGERAESGRHPVFLVARCTRTP
ncbi:MAG: class I SAM-dependent methyltransferase [Mycobacteriales bacterium]